MSRRKKLQRCNKTGLVIFEDELEAKIVLAKRIRNDRGEKRYFPCGKHFHLSATDWNGDVDHRAPA